MPFRANSCLSERKCMGGRYSSPNKSSSPQNKLSISSAKAWACSSISSSPISPRVFRWS